MTALALVGLTTPATPAAAAAAKHRSGVAHKSGGVRKSGGAHKSGAHKSVLAAPSVAAASPVPHAVSAPCSGYLPAGSVVGMATTADDGGYWIANSSGQVVSCGDAPGLGSLNIVPTHPIVGIAATPNGGGFWLVASDGGVFSFGNAQFWGSTGSLVLNKPIVGMATDPATGGYWLVASDGGVFSFDAPFHGSTGNLRLNQPVVGMSAAPGTDGYWLVASDGGIFTFGAPFFGSIGAVRLNQPVVGMADDAATGGYWLVAGDGGVFAFNSPFLGSTGNLHLAKPVVGMEAATSGIGLPVSWPRTGVSSPSARPSSTVRRSRLCRSAICTVTMSNPNPKGGSARDGHHPVDGPQRHYHIDRQLQGPGVHGHWGHRWFRRTATSSSTSDTRSPTFRPRSSPTWGTAQPSARPASRPGESHGWCASAPEHQLPRSSVAVVAILADPAFYLDLALPDLSRPELVEEREAGGVAVIRLRYQFEGNLDPMARRLIGSGRLAWIQQVRIDRQAATGSLRFEAERDPGRLHGSAEFVIAPEGTGAVRHLDGQLVVAVPGVGRLAERRIVPGILRRLDIEARATDDRIEGSG